MCKRLSRDSSRESPSGFGQWVASFFEISFTLEANLLWSPSRLYPESRATLDLFQLPAYVHHTEVLFVCVDAKLIYAAKDIATLSENI